MDLATKLTYILEVVEPDGDLKGPWSAKLREQFKELWWNKISGKSLQLFDSVALAIGEAPVDMAALRGLKSVGHKDPANNILKLTAGELKKIVVGNGGKWGDILLPTFISDKVKLAKVMKYLIPIFLGFAPEKGDVAVKKSWLFTIVNSPSGTSRPAYAYGAKYEMTNGDTREWTFLDIYDYLRTKTGGKITGKEAPNIKFVRRIKELEESRILTKVDWEGFKTFRGYDKEENPMWKHESGYRAFTSTHHPKTVMIVSLERGEGLYLIKNMLTIDRSLDRNPSKEVETLPWKKALNRFWERPINVMGKKEVVARLTGKSKEEIDQMDDATIKKAISDRDRRTRLLFRDYVEKKGEGLFILKSNLDAIDAWVNGEDDKFREAAKRAGGTPSEEVLEAIGINLGFQKLLSERLENI